MARPRYAGLGLAQKAVTEDMPQLDGAGVSVPKGGRRWWPAEDQPPLAETIRRAVYALTQRRPSSNNFSTWQMAFPAEMPDGAPCPLSALGECGDPTCPSNRTKHPEVREAVETFIVEQCMRCFGKDCPLCTYVSVGCGLLAQDWLVLEKLRQVGHFPSRVVLVELRTAKPRISCEGGSFPRKAPCEGIDLRQTGFCGELGPEFAFSAAITFWMPCERSTLFEFSTVFEQDSIFVRIGGPDELGKLDFGVCVDGQQFCLPVEQCWVPGPEVHKYLFTCSATGTLRVYVDSELVAVSHGIAPVSAVRSSLAVGQSNTGVGVAFNGIIQQIKVWDLEVDWASVDLLYASEVEAAVRQFTQWCSGERAVWTFGSLAAYAAAAKADARFAADLLMKVDVHEEFDGYDDLVCQALSPHGLALTLGGPGTSWYRRGGGWCPLTSVCDTLDKAEAKTKLPWALLGALPGRPDSHAAPRPHCAEAAPCPPTPAYGPLEHGSEGDLRSPRCMTL